MQYILEQQDVSKQASTWKTRGSIASWLNVQRKREKVYHGSVSSDVIEIERGVADFAKKNSLHYPKAGPSSVPDSLRAFSNSHQLAVKGRPALPQGSPFWSMGPVECLKLPAQAAQM